MNSPAQALIHVRFELISYTCNNMFMRHRNDEYLDDQCKEAQSNKEKQKKQRREKDKWRKTLQVLRRWVE